MKPSIEVIRPSGYVSYSDGLRIQHERREAVERGKACEALFLLQHSPVFTLGRKWQPQNLLRSREQYEQMGIDVCETERGGDVTYHGPGQMVAYPILNLGLRQPSIQWYLRSLEEVLIRQLRGYGLEAGRKEGFTGVWIGEAKIAAIGIKIHNWVTCHGIALNVDPDMSHFGLIIPCGISDHPVISLKSLLHAETPDMSTVMDDFEREFGACLG